MGLATVLAILVILAILVAAFGGLFTYIYWWLIQRPVPRLDGEVELSGLEEPVEVLRDKHGVPHLYAGNEADLWLALGYVHAQDRLWQMEQRRRIASGRLAEYFGRAALDVDRFSRVLGFRRMAEKEWRTLPANVQSVVKQYVAGINAYLQARPGRQAAEFNLLRVQPEPWTPVDVLALAKVMAWTQSVNWESEVTRLQIARQMDSTRASELEPGYPDDMPVISEAVDDEEAMRMVYTAGLLLVEYDKVKRWMGDIGAVVGSNAWVVGPARSQTDRPMLCHDPHHTLTMPGVLYEAHLACPQVEAVGATYAGMPGILSGHNQHIAWGMANALADVQDLFVEKRHPQDPHRFKSEDEWEDAEVWDEVIHVRKEDVPHVEQVVITHNGPLVSELLGKSASTALAIKWTGQSGTGALESVLALNRAQDWEQFRRALYDWKVPTFNFVYADVDGNIGYQMAGAVPVRGRDQGAPVGLTPAPGWRDEYGWTGTIPYDELPGRYNPGSGLVVAANNKMVGDDYPYFLGLETDPGWRAQRIQEMLRMKKRLNTRDMTRIQLDTTSLYAERLTPLLTLQESDDPFVKIAVNALRNWSYRMEADSDAALVFHYTLRYLIDMTFGDKLGSAYAGYRGEQASPLFGEAMATGGFARRAEVRLLELLRSHEESIWYTEASSGRRRSRDELIQEALLRAVKRIRREVNSSPRHWAWGRMHQIRYNHPMGSVRILGGYFNRGPFPVGGDGTTVNLTEYAPDLPPGLVQVMASYRQIVDVGNWDMMQTVTTSGQSGHPLSDNYADQLPMWQEGTYHAMPWTRPSVEEATEHRLVLRPERGG